MVWVETKVMIVMYGVVGEDDGVGRAEGDDNDVWSGGADNDMVHGVGRDDGGEEEEDVWSG